MTLIRPSFNLVAIPDVPPRPEVTITRAGTATRINRHGLVEVVAANTIRHDYHPVTGEYLGWLVEESRTNLFTYSEQFDNAAWGKNNVTVTANFGVAPDGTMSSDRVLETVTNGLHRIPQTVAKTASALPYTFSFFVKASGRATVDIVMSDATGYAETFFNTTTGVFSGTVVASGFVLGGTRAQAFPNGWWRVELTATTTAGTAVTGAIGICDDIGANSYAGDITKGFELWGAQLEAAAFATSYTPSTDTFTSRASSATFVGSNGLIQTAATNVARINFNPANLSVAGKLLCEVAATNLSLYSEQFSNASGWTPSGLTSVTADNTTSPDGTNTADRLVEDSSAASEHRVLSVGTIAWAGNTTYCFSVYVKGNGRNIDLLLNTAGNWVSSLRSATFNTTTGAVMVNNAQSAGSQQFPNGWWRFWIIATTVASPSASGLTIRLADSSGLASYNGDGTSGVFLWGAQVETGLIPTSYIQTVASTVTRSADVCSSSTTTRNADLVSVSNITSFLNPSEITVYSDSQLNTTVINNSTAKAVLDVSDGTTSNRAVYRLQGSTGVEGAVIRFGGTTIATLSPAPAATTNRKRAALALKLDDFALSSNAITPLTDTSGAFPLGLNQMLIGSSVGNTEYLNGWIRHIAIFPRRLSNADLQEITM